MLQGLDSREKRRKIYEYIEEALKVALDHFYSDETSDSNRLGWGRLVLKCLHEMAALVKDDLMEKNREDIENLKTFFRMRGEKL